MTEPIKLPPLPYPQIPGNDYTAKDMQDYATAAIEADRMNREDFINDDRDQLRAEIVALKGTIDAFEADRRAMQDEAEKLSRAKHYGSGYQGDTRSDCPGISLRDYFAAKAMQGWVTDPAMMNIEENRDYAASFAYAMADAMLAAAPTIALKEQV